MTALTLLSLAQEVQRLRTENERYRSFLEAELAEATEEADLWADPDDGDDLYAECWRRRADRLRHALSHPEAAAENVIASESVLDGVSQ